VSPRKSSTSSANPSPRPRYLGLEVAGVPVPLIRRWLEGELARRLAVGGDDATPSTVRVIRWAGDRGLLALDVQDLPRARTAWNADLTTPDRRTVRIATARTWGTLRLGKRWLDRPRSAAVAAP
jgi:hypothetical protein